MKKDSKKAAAEAQAAPEAKPPARKKKIADPEPQAAPEPPAVVQVAQLESETVKAKPAKKPTRKSSPAKKATAPAVESSPEAQAKIDSEIEPAPPKLKKSKKAKGRDLVADEPGAAEVAAVLHTPLDTPTPAPAPKPKQELKPEPKPEAKLERLQKILARAGISSRRKAEELILGGSVQVNGSIVTELGTKADPARDHIRVDGKLLQGPERIRYFVLNKPKGFVTTVSDPEGRPTVMQFFAGEHERLYPVGRLDYLSEGLLLVTNDGELANKLTKAASGVEKTYLVKVAGQPTEEMLDVIRTGVVIEKGRPGTHSGRVRTAPAQIRQVRQGDNPWYEVVVIEGRNRELRKIFEEIGHHVEKIRRVGYGPLVLDLEPGKLRELEAEEVRQLRLASEGKLKTKRRRPTAAAQLPTVAGKAVRYKKADGKPGYEPRTRSEARPETRPEARSAFKPVSRKAVRPEFQQESKAGFNPAFRADSRPGFKKDFKPVTRPGSRPDARPDARPSSKPAFRPEFKREAKPEFRQRFEREGKPEFKSGTRPNFKSASESASRSGFKSGGRPAFGSKPRREEPPVTDYVLPPRKPGAPGDDFDAKSGHQGPGFNPGYKPGFRTGAKPAFRSDRPASKPAYRADSPKRFGAGDSARSERPSKPAGFRSGGTQPLGKYNAAEDDFVPKKTPGFRVEPVEHVERGEARPRSGGFNRGSAGGKPFRPTGARPSSGARPFRPSARPDSAGNSQRPARFTPRSDSGGPPARRSSSAGEDRPREFRPRPTTRTDGPPKTFKSAKPGRTPSAQSGPGGEPRKKERWRNSFTGKNKGRPKPKP